MKAAFWGFQKFMFLKTIALTYYTHVLRSQSIGMPENNQNKTDYLHTANFKPTYRPTEG